MNTIEYCKIFYKIKYLLFIYLIVFYFISVEV